MKARLLKMLRTDHHRSGWRNVVFLDEDGTLIRNSPVNMDLEEVRFLPGTYEGLRLFSEMGFLLVVVTNQPGFSVRYRMRDDFNAGRRRISRLFEECRTPLHGFYHSPHASSPRRLYQAAKDLHIELSRSWMIGDTLDDVEAGHRAGCRSILIYNGNEKEWRLSEKRFPDYVVSHLQEAATLIQGLRKRPYAFQKNSVVS